MPLRAIDDRLERAVSQESVARVSDARRRGALRFTSRCFKGRSQKRRNRSYLALDPPAAEIVIARARVRPRDKGLPMRLARSGVSAPGGWCIAPPCSGSEAVCKPHPRRPSGRVEHPTRRSVRASGGTQ